MRYLALIAIALSCALVACQSPKPEKRVPAGQQVRQDPITDQGVDATKSRLVTAANIVLKYAEKHGTFPVGTDSLKLRDTLRPEFGNEPGFEELWVSHNGKALVLYNQNLPGKSLPQVGNLDSTWLLKDPVGFPAVGHVTTYCSGRVDTVMERPAASGQMG